MTEAKEIRATLEEHQAAIRKIEADLREAIGARAELEPSGLFAMFRARRDPQRLEELTTEIEILKQEMLHRRTQLEEARKRQEALEREAHKSACVPAWVQDEQAAARLIQALGELDPLLTQLRSMATAASIGRANQRRRVGVGRRTRNLSTVLQSSRIEDATASTTAQWEPVLDRAERLADGIGMPLVLPRRYRAAARPPHAPDPGIQAARDAARCSSDLEFGPALETVVPRISQAQMHCTYARATLAERFPQAGALATTLPDAVLRAPDPSAVGTPSSGVHSLIELWDDQRKLFAPIQSLARRGASTLQLLDPVGRWQRQANAIRAHPLAREHDLLPPINDGATLTDFLTRLFEEWPALDERFEAWRASTAP